MSGVLGSLAAAGSIIGPVARAAEAIANAVGLSVQRKTAEDERQAGATAAENETMRDTSEIADAQAKLNSEHPDVLDIARELRAEADAADRRSDKPGAGAAGKTG